MERLPAPRLQLRWRQPTSRERRRARCGCDWTCVYELILPVQEGDIRRKNGSDELALEIGRTFVGNSIGEKIMDYAPFRDGAHARWDSEALGGLPVFVIGSDGVARKQPNKSAITSGGE